MAHSDEFVVIDLLSGLETLLSAEDTVHYKV